MVTMNRLSTDKRAAIIGCLVEGNSIRATVRITGAASPLKLTHYRSARAP